MLNASKNTKLAIDGGAPVRARSLPPWPHYAQDEIAAVTAVLASGKVNYWTGDIGQRFEAEFAAAHGARHGVALANGTLALELALRVLGVGAGDEVIVTPRSYFASASCIVLSGATPVFADVDRASQNLTAETIGQCVTPRTKAIIVVHLAGWPCDMPRIMALAKAHDLNVIEDCAQAHGAGFAGQPVGSFGDVATFSFCQDKIMSTGGEGGMLLTNDRDYWEAAWSYKDHGKSWQLVHAANPPPGFRWLHAGFGSNWRLTEMQAALGRLQLAKLAAWVTKRRHNASRLIDGLADQPALRIPCPSPGEFNSYYKCYAFVEPDALRTGWSRDRLIDALQAEGIPGLSGSCPEIYREAAFADAQRRRLPVAKELGETSLMFLVHPTMEDPDIDATIAAVRKVLSVATE